MHYERMKWYPESEVEGAKNHQDALMGLLVMAQEDHEKSLRIFRLGVKRQTLTLADLVFVWFRFPDPFHSEAQSLIEKMLNDLGYLGLAAGDADILN